MNKEQATRLRQQLFTGEGEVYAILDGAGIPDLLPKLYDAKPPFECLYRGELEPDIAAVAPYLVHLEANSALVDWILQSGWGKGWGIFVSADGNLPAMRRHFRRFLTVHDEAGKPMLFRFYDPRVLRLYLPTCTPKELSLLFTSIRFYLMEGETDKAARLMQLTGGQLAAKDVPL